MSFELQSHQWPARRAILLVHGIGNAKEGDYSQLVTGIESVLGDAAAETVIYQLWYDQVNDWFSGMFGGANPEPAAPLPQAETPVEPPPIAIAPSTPSPQAGAMQSPGVTPSWQEPAGAAPPELPPSLQRVPEIVRSDAPPAAAPPRGPVTLRIERGTGAGTVISSPPVVPYVPAAPATPLPPPASVSPPSASPPPASPLPPVLPTPSDGAAVPQ